MGAYFDNAATTKMCEAALNAFIKANETYANPSSLHSMGLEAEKLVSSSRKKVLSALGAKSGTLIFTGCGTDSNALAIFGTAYAKNANKGKSIIISDSEHPSVYNSAKELENRGFKLKLIPTKNGVIDKELFLSEIDENTFLTSIMTANNETGALYDIANLCKAAKEKNRNVIFHTDATQAFLKTDLFAVISSVDMLTVSAHKIGGPKGVGALYVSDKIMQSRALSPVLYGGGQEYGMRSGTENTAGIAAFAAAAEYGASKMKENVLNMLNLKSKITHELEKTGVKINKPVNALPNIISATLPMIKSEVMLQFLSGNGIYISSGSACSSHHPGISRPMQAFGLSSKEADCTVRISLCGENTEEEADELIKYMSEGVKNLIKMRK